MSDSSDPMDCSLPGSFVHGIFQAKVLEWGAIAFSDDFHNTQILVLVSRDPEPYGTWIYNHPLVSARD